MEQYLQPTQVINYGHPSVAEFVRKHAGDSSNPRVQSINLYYAVRDLIRYDPYSAEVSIDGLRASRTLSEERGNCIAKATLLTACCRALGIPARVGFADVRNHMTTERMRQHVEDDVFYWHGYASIFLDGTWVKATPAFNIELCQSFGINPLDFDGCNDALFHPFDRDGKKHMEYIAYRGEFADVPIDQIKDTYTRRYNLGITAGDADFQQEIEQEASRA